MVLFLRVHTKELSEFQEKENLLTVALGLCLNFFPLINIKLGCNLCIVIDNTEGPIGRPIGSGVCTLK